MASKIHAGILSDKRLTRSIKDGKIKIEPFDERLVRPCSYLLTLSGVDSIVLEPYQSLCCNTKQIVGILRDYIATFSNVADLTIKGVMAMMISGHIEVGNVSSPHILLFNTTKYPVLLSKDIVLGQLIFSYVGSVEKSYQEDGVYVTSDQRIASVWKPGHLGLDSRRRYLEIKTATSGNGVTKKVEKVEPILVKELSNIWATSHASQPGLLPAITVNQPLPAARTSSLANAVTSSQANEFGRSSIIGLTNSDFDSLFEK